MKTQIIKDKSGKPTGVFIPIDDRENIKKHNQILKKLSKTHLNGKKKSLMNVCQTKTIQINSSLLNIYLMY